MRFSTKKTPFIERYFFASKNSFSMTASGTRIFHSFIIPSSCPNLCNTQKDLLSFVLCIVEKDLLSFVLCIVSRVVFSTTGDEI
jgi:hypothetical protein